MKPSLTNKLLDRLVLPGALGFTRLGFHLRQRSWTPITNSLAGKTVVITGATSGLGLAAAHRLARLNARIILVGRNARKTRRVQQEISRATGNQGIDIQIADLSLLADVRALADRLLETEPRVDVLINNAAVLPSERQITSEGLEQTFATNLLAPFALTRWLLPLLRQSSPARIVNVVSGGMYLSGIDTGNLQNEKGEFDGARAYARAKRGLMILTEQWADELENSAITVNAMHPGWAATPGVKESLPAFYRVTRPMLRNAEQGADTMVWLAAAPEPENHSGLLWFDREPHLTSLFPNTRGSERERAILRHRLTEMVASLDHQQPNPKSRAA